MKPRINVHLSEQVAERLEFAAKRPGVSKTAIVEAALAGFLGPAGDTGADTAVLRGLDRINRQLEQVERDLRIVSETVALHARYQLTITPAVPPSEQRAACALGLERFETFAAQVGRRVHLGMPLMRETMERVSEASSDVFTRDMEEDAAPCSKLTDPESGVLGPSVVDEEPEPLAAAPEGGSHGGIPEERDSPSR